MASVYHDRRMLKWLPFEALETQGQALKELYHALEKTDKPVLSEDQLALMQYKLEMALKTQAQLTFKVYNQGYIAYISGQIERLDMINRTIILKDNILFVDDILDIFD